MFGAKNSFSSVTLLFLCVFYCIIIFVQYRIYQRENADIDFGEVDVESVYARIAADRGKITDRKVFGPETFDYTAGKLVNARLVGDKVLGYPNGSFFIFTYNNAYTLMKNKNGSYSQVLVARCQHFMPNVARHLSRRVGMRVTGWGPGPSVVTFSTNPTLDNFTHGFSYISRDDVILQPKLLSDELGTEDPRVVHVNGTYLLYYTAVEWAKNGAAAAARLSLATCSAGPECFAAGGAGQSKWVRRGPLFPDDTFGFQFTKSGALLIGRNYTESFLIFGDCSGVDGLQVAKPSEDYTHYKLEPGLIFKKRPGMWDGALIESGPEPLQLKTGDWLMIYNAAQHNRAVPNGVFYNPGWVVLDGTNPRNVHQRAEDPLMMPTHTWMASGLTPYVVFIEGMRYASTNLTQQLFENKLWVDKDPNIRYNYSFIVYDTKLCNEPEKTDEQKFVVYFGAADAEIGSACLIGTWTKEAETTIKAKRR